MIRKLFFLYNYDNFANNQKQLEQDQKAVSSLFETYVPTLLKDKLEWRNIC